ncbi:hypothetical protein KI387_012348, partial [Taxus chinensis]
TQREEEKARNDALNEEMENKNEEKMEKKSCEQVQANYGPVKSESAAISVMRGSWRALTSIDQDVNEKSEEKHDIDEEKQVNHEEEDKDKERDQVKQEGDKAIEKGEDQGETRNMKMSSRVGEEDEIQRSNREIGRSR